MTILQLVVPTLEGVPTQFHELYSVAEGGFALTGVDTKVADVQRLTTALEKERAVAKAAKADVARYASESAELAAFKEAQRKKQEDTIIPPDTKQNHEANSRLVMMEAQQKKLADELSAALATLEQANSREKLRTIHDEVRKAANAANIRTTAVDDVLMYAGSLFERSDDGNVLTKDGLGVTPGVSPTAWITEIAAKKPHWFPENKGGGAGGGSGQAPLINPWSKATASLTLQGKLQRENPTLAAQLKKAALSG